MKNGVLLLMAAVCWTGPANAQVASSMPDTVNAGPGELSIPPVQEQLNQKQVREAMLKFAGCVARRHPREAEQFVVNPALMADKKWDRFLDSDCLVDAVSGQGDSVELRTYNSDVRFALAQVLVTKRLAAFNNPDIRRAAALPPPPSDPATLALVGGYFALDALGECVVRSNPESARSLLTSPAASKQEALTMQVLMPAFSQCVPQGRQFKADLPTLRGLVAIAFYRLATAPTDASKTERGQ